jgi:hypothetical protein
MEIVEIRFIMDSQSVQTGNEFYPSGATAHFFVSQASALVNQGHAVLVNPPPNAEPSFLHGPDYSEMTVKELKNLASNIPGASRMRKADLVAVLEEST